jgi:hypothetical protein
MILGSSGQPIDDELVAIVGAHVGFQRICIEADIALEHGSGGTATGGTQSFEVSNNYLRICGRIRDLAPVSRR